MQIKLVSLIVNDQRRALKFYTEVLGFQVKHDIPMGEHAWITVVSPEDPEGAELVLEPNNNPVLNGGAMAWQKLLVDNEIPATAFFVTDIQAEYERLVKRGVEFTTPPTPAGPVTIAVLNDTCGNLIQIVQA
ncbi:MAG TPA: VOC family protein [Candidatus Thermoplasmatota archaeon]|nr:VOC family protein [Candidatus Thermoplasmatota archaeon]